MQNSCADSERELLKIIHSFAYLVTLSREKTVGLYIPSHFHPPLDSFLALEAKFVHLLTD